MVDPLADVPHSVGLTPYHYAANDPINNIDPDGMDWYRNNETGEEYWQEGDGEVEGATHIGANHVIKGTNGNIYHEQNRVVAYERTTTDPGSGAGETMSRALAASAVIVADDVTGIGVADDVVIPFVLGGAALYSGYQYLTYDPMVGSFNDPYIQRANDSSAGERHGDGGRFLESDTYKKEKARLENEIRTAPNKKVRTRLKKKLQRLNEKGQKRRQGETHWN